MSRTVQEPPRRRTRSMASSTIRRSSRLSSTRERQSQPHSSLLPGPFGPHMHPGINKRKRPSVPLDEPRNLKSRKDCEQIEVLVESRMDSSQSTVFGGSSVPTPKTVVCNRRESSRVNKLEEELGMARQAKHELAAQLKEHKINSAQSTLKHLEEYFTCPLCFEILACPYALTPRNCGHTFCATCILKWFFSRLHKGCGSWHEAVDCPLCRSALPHTPERTPRSSSSFPFIPNRTADTAIRGLMNTISHELDTLPTVASNTLSCWNEGGHNEQEWSKRERIGRTEMASIAAQWNTLKPTDFVNIKDRLEV